MALEHSDADEAVLSMLQRYQILMMEDLIIGRPDFSYAQLFLAVDRLSRKKMISLHRMGLSYQIQPTNQMWSLGQRQHHKESSAQLR